LPIPGGPTTVACRRIWFGRGNTRTGSIHFATRHCLDRKRTFLVCDGIDEAEALEFGFAADEPDARGGPTDGPVHRGDRLPDGHRLRLPLCLHRLRLGVLDRMARGAVCLLADEHPVHGRTRLDARRGVHHVAGGHPLPLARPRVERDERLAGIDAGADVQVEPLVRLVQLANRVADRQRRPHGALGIVLVRDGRPEQRHHRVAAELLERSSEPLELRTHARVIRGDHRLHVLGIEPLGAGGRADQVGEDDGDELPLLGRNRRSRSGRDRRAAREAETRLVGVLLPAARADRHAARVRRAEGSF
jgi:hypothetical protein